MSSKITTIEVYPSYNLMGKCDVDLPFSYGCPELDLMGYLRLDTLIKDIRRELKKQGDK